MKEPVPSQLIDKYLNGACSAEEEAQLLEWYGSFASEHDPLLSLDEKQKEALKYKLLAKIYTGSGIDTKSGSVRKPSIGRAFLYSAASIAAVLLLVLNWYNPKNTDVAQPKMVKQVSAAINFTNQTTKLNKHVLPDNSVVWLKPGAQLKYNREFLERAVTLKGEAFFDVEKDPEHPFSIHSGGVITKVLGTSFNVKTDEITNTTEVSVVTGKVLVYTPASHEQKAKSVFLLPMQKVTYVMAKHELIKQKSVKEPALAIWKKSSLSFENTPVVEVVKTLNTTFKSKIIIADRAIDQYTLKADFTDVNLPTILELLSKSLNITYIIQEDNEIQVFSKTLNKPNN